MLVIVTYDVSTTDKGGAQRLRHVAKECQNYGQRVQNSVFECYIDYAKYVYLKDKLSGIIDKEQDNLRFYMVGNKYEGKIESVGLKKDYTPEGLLII